jgi:DNA repair protein RadC
LILGNGNFQSLRQITDLWEKYPQEDWQKRHSIK